MHFVDRAHVASVITGKRIALVGSGPGAVENPRGFVDSQDVVVRVNNYKLQGGTGNRTDVFYSFFGNSIRKTADELQRDGVKLCIAKCPDAKFIDSKWHEARRKTNGVDFRYIYETRKDWWFCPTYVPSVDEFMAHFNQMRGHVPTTGFAALLDLLSYHPANIHMTGFDFFQSHVHNVNEPWRMINHSDPIGHTPDGERAWLAANIQSLPVTIDPLLAQALVKGVQPRRMPPRSRLHRLRSARA